MVNIYTKLCRSLLIAGTILTFSAFTFAAPALPKIACENCLASADADDVTADTIIKPVTVGDYKVDPHHTSIIFKVKHMGISNFTARFNKVEGLLEYDYANVKNSSIHIVIDPASIDTNFQSLDEDLKDEDALSVAKFPEITFTSTKVIRTGAKTGIIVGDFTMRGVTKPVRLNTTLVGAIQHGKSKPTVIGFRATGKLKRSDFGFTEWMSMIGDDVSFEIEIEFVQS